MNKGFINVVIIIVIVAVALGVGYFWGHGLNVNLSFNSQSISPTSSAGKSPSPSVKPSASDIQLPSYLLPLPSGINWSQPVAASAKYSVYNDMNPEAAPKSITLNGYKIHSDVRKVNSDIFSYYDSKLTKLGWKKDLGNETDGPTGGQSAYVKNGKHVLLMVKIENDGPEINGAPICPCQYTYSIFYE